MLLGLLFSHRRRALVLVLLFNPFVLWPFFAVFGTAADYVRGEARYHSYGKPGFSSGNLDRALRCYRNNHGCVSGTEEWLYADPANRTLRELVRAFGPQRGVWTGPIPLEHELKAKIAKAGPMPLEQVGRWLRGQGVDPETWQLRQTLQSVEVQSGALSVHVGIAEGGLLFLGTRRAENAPEELTSLARDTQPAGFLFDPDTGRYVAGYRWWPADE